MGGCDFSESSLADLLFEHCELRKATLSGVRLKRVELRSCDLTGLQGVEGPRGAPVCPGTTCSRTLRHLQRTLEIID
jgi:uncharacterized protein YjbI with pentapeptide repeats